MPYTVRWTRISEHHRELSDEEMADVKSVSLAQLANMDVDEIQNGLEDELAELEDDGLKGLVRTVGALIRR